MPSARPSPGPRPDRARRAEPQDLSQQRAAALGLLWQRPGRSAGRGGWGLGLGPWLPQTQAWAGIQPSGAWSTRDFLGQRRGGWEPAPRSSWGPGGGVGHAPNPHVSLRRCTQSLPWGLAPAPSPLTPPRRARCRLCPGLPPARVLARQHLLPVGAWPRPAGLLEGPALALRPQPPVRQWAGPQQEHVVPGPQPRSEHAHTATGGLQPSGNIPKTQGQNTTARKDPPMHRHRRVF